MVWQGNHAYRNIVLGFVLPLMLAGCFMNAPIEPAAVTDASPPTGVNGAPRISGNAPRVVKVGVSYSFTPQSMDPDGDDLSFSVSNCPMWLSFDTSNGNLSGIPQLGHEGTYNDIEIAVSDGKASTVLPQFSISVEPSTTPNMPPEIDGTPAPSVTVADAYSFSPSGSDPDGDTLTYSIVNKPTWAVFNTFTGQLSGVPQADNIGISGGIAISVSDGTLSSSLPMFSINVIAANSAPTIGGTPTTNVTVGQSYSFTAAASDPDGDTLTFDVLNLPGWAQFDTTTGSLSGTPQSDDVGSYGNISIRVSDGKLSDILPDFTITVDPISLGAATLNWAAPTENMDGSALTNLAGFNIYYGTSPGYYPNQITINNPGITTYVVEDLSADTWYFVSTSFNSAGVESDFSNAISKTIN